jgi:hypothetical protein
MNPPQHGLILAAELGRPGGGVVGALSDLRESQETLADPGMVRPERQAS